MVDEKKKLQKRLIEQFLAIGNERDMLDFLQGILTPHELEELPVRLEIVRLLKTGVSQHEIARQLGVGVATVTRGSKELQNGHFTKV